MAEYDENESKWNLIKKEVEFKSEFVQDIMTRLEMRMKSLQLTQAHNSQTIPRSRKNSTKMEVILKSEPTEQVPVAMISTEQPHTSNVKTENVDIFTGRTNIDENDMKKISMVLQEIKIEQIEVIGEKLKINIDPDFEEENPDGTILIAVDNKIALWYIF